MHCGPDRMRSAICTLKIQYVLENSWRQDVFWSRSRNNENLWITRILDNKSLTTILVNNDKINIEDILNDFTENYGFIVIWIILNLELFEVFFNRSTMDRCLMDIGMN